MLLSHLSKAMRLCGNGSGLAALMMHSTTSKCLTTGASKTKSVTLTGR
jgi:hypothetical protein